MRWLSQGKSWARGKYNYSSQLDLVQNNIYPDRLM